MTEFNKNWAFLAHSLSFLPSTLIPPPVLQWVSCMSFRKSIMLPLTCLPTMWAWTMLENPISNCQGILSHFTGSPFLYCMHAFCLQA